MTEEKQTSTYSKADRDIDKDTKISRPKVILTILVLILVIFGGYLYRQGSLKIGSIALNLDKDVLSEEAAKDKITDYINNELLQGQATAELSQLEKKSGVYAFKVKIGGQEVESYVTIDGKLLFPTGIKTTTATKTDNSETKNNNSTNTEISKSDNPEVLLFTMSFCPYGNQAEEGIKPVVDLLGESLEVKPHYVIYNNYGGGGPEYCLDEANKYCSMHGIQELNQDVRELCVYKYQKDKFWDFVEQINKDCTSKDVDTCWEKVAEATGVDKNQISTCQTNEALDLLADEVALNEQYNIKGSPTLIINGTTYQGGRAPEDYKNAICGAYNQTPEKCNESLSANSSSTGDASCGD